MKTASYLLFLAAALQVVAIAVLGGSSLVPLLVGAAIAALAAIIVGRGTRGGVWVGFLVALGGVILSAGFAGGATGLASLAFWATCAATAGAAILLFGALWRSPTPA